MRFAFTEEQQAFGASVRKALQRSAGEDTVRAAWDDDRGDLWKPLRDTGLFELHALGLGMADLVLPLEETGRAAVPLPVVETLAVAVPALARWPELTAETVAVCDRGRCADANAADLVLSLDDQHISRLDDVSTVRLETVDRGQRLFEVSGTATPLGDAGDLFDRAVVGTSAVLLGLARHMLETSVEYAKLRTQFGKPIGSFQAVKHHLANALLHIEFAAPAVYRAAWSIDRAHPERGVHASMAKVYAAKAASLASETALQCHGAIGYSFEYGLHLWMKRAWSLSDAWRDPAWHRARVAQHLGVGVK